MLQHVHVHVHVSHARTGIEANAHLLHCTKRAAHLLFIVRCPICRHECGAAATRTDKYSATGSTQIPSAAAAMVPARASPTAYCRIDVAWQEGASTVSAAADHPPRAILFSCPGPPSMIQASSSFTSRGRGACASACALKYSSSVWGDELLLGALPRRDQRLWQPRRPIGMPMRRHRKRSQRPTLLLEVRLPSHQLPTARSSPSVRPPHPWRGLKIAWGRRGSATPRMISVRRPQSHTAKIPFVAPHQAIRTEHPRSNWGRIVVAAVAMASAVAR